MVVGPCTDMFTLKRAEFDSLRGTFFFCFIYWAVGCPTLKPIPGSGLEANRQLRVLPAAATGHPHTGTAAGRTQQRARPPPELTSARLRCRCRTAAAAGRPAGHPLWRDCDCDLTQHLAFFLGSLARSSCANAQVPNGIDPSEQGYC